MLISCNFSLKRIKEEKGYKHNVRRKHRCIWGLANMLRKVPNADWHMVGAKNIINTPEQQRSHWDERDRCDVFEGPSRALEERALSGLSFRRLLHGALQTQGCTGPNLKILSGSSASHGRFRNTYLSPEDLCTTWFWRDICWNVNELTFHGMAHPNGHRF